MSSPAAAVKFLVGQLALLTQIHPEHQERVVGEILQREALGSTAIGRGVAIPHAISDAVETVVGVIGRVQMPVSWPGTLLDDAPIRMIVLIVTPKSRPGDGLRALEGISRWLR